VDVGELAEVAFLVVAGVVGRVFFAALLLLGLQVSLLGYRGRVRRGKGLLEVRPESAGCWDGEPVPFMW
jgi:hypothetical protein